MEAPVRAVDRDAFRAVLASKSGAAEVVLCLPRIAANEASITVDEAIEEALMDGWVADRIEPIDALHYARVFVRRASPSDADLRRLRALSREGRLREGGLRLQQRSEAAWLQALEVWRASYADALGCRTREDLARHMSRPVPPSQHPEDAHEDVMNLYELAQTELEAGQWEHAVAHLRLVEQVTRGDGDFDRRELALDLAEANARIGNVEHARRWWDEAKSDAGLAERIEAVRSLLEALPPPQEIAIRRYRHARFGEGTLVARTASGLRIAFADGERVIAESRLEPVD